MTRVNANPMLADLGEGVVRALASWISSRCKQWGVWDPGCIARSARSDIASRSSSFGKTGVF